MTALPFSSQSQREVFHFLAEAFPPRLSKVEAVTSCPRKVTFCVLISREPCRSPHLTSTHSGHPFGSGSIGTGSLVQP